MSAKLNIVNTFENSTKKPIVFLVLIGLAGLLLRLVYFPYDVPLFNDSQGYFWYATDAIQIMSLAVVPGTIAILYSSKFLGMEKSKFVMIPKLVSLGVMIGGFLYFGPIYGAIGLAWIIVTISAWEAIFLFTMDRTLKAS